MHKSIVTQIPTILLVSNLAEEHKILAIAGPQVQITAVLAIAGPPVQITVDPHRHNHHVLTGGNYKATVVFVLLMDTIKIKTTIVLKTVHHRHLGKPHFAVFLAKYQLLANQWALNAVVP